MKLRWQLATDIVFSKVIRRVSHIICQVLKKGYPLRKQRNGYEQVTGKPVVPTSLRGKQLYVVHGSKYAKDRVAITKQKCHGMHLGKQVVYGEWMAQTVECDARRFLCTFVISTARREAPPGGARQCNTRRVANS